MIGVRCHDAELAVVREFFELFKTPWERDENGAARDVVLVSTPDPVSSVDARLVVVFAPAEQARAAAGGDPVVIESDGVRLPIYGGLLDEPVAVERGEERTVVRCGYNLFAEVEHLLTIGQPVEHALTPTLDLHIALLRRWITEAGAPLVEIPPVPPGYDLLACLTHDVDFLGIRRHKLDRTLAGFLYRATVGSLLDSIAGRRSVRQLLRNWRAALELPLVHAGLLADPWMPFDRYAAIEGDLRSTFFLVPFRGRAGRGPDGTIDRRRAVPYGVQEARSHAERLERLGFEVGVHGIDAWNDAERGRAERGAVAAVAGPGPLGVRMHWLYLDEDSPARLDEAGFDYDSTVGYNDAVGFRAGTTQAYRPLGAGRLLELPLHVQDTAMLYPRRMHVRARDALQLCEGLMERTAELGGVLTVSWHERSLVPERQWDDVYRQLLDALRRRGAAVRPARDIVAWFRARRSVDLEGADLTGADLDRLAAGGEAQLRLRVHHPDSGVREVPTNAEELDRLLDASRSARV